MLDKKNVWELLDDFEAARISKRKAVERIYKAMHGDELRHIDLVIHTLNELGLGYEVAEIKGLIYISLIANRKQVLGDEHCFAQFEFDQRGQLMSFGTFFHEIQNKNEQAPQ